LALAVNAQLRKYEKHFIEHLFLCRVVLFSFFRYSLTNWTTGLGIRMRALNVQPVSSAYAEATCSQ